jgi:co-chaperonin GroES (HSP10)
MSSSKIYKGTLTPIHNRVIVTDMEFGEQKTAGGIIIASDDGQARGIHPRWGKVFAIGHENDDEYEIGDWILVDGIIEGIVEKIGFRSTTIRSFTNINNSIFCKLKIWNNC